MVAQAWRARGALALAALAVATAATSVPVHGEAAARSTLAGMMEKQMERSSALIEHLFGVTLGWVDEGEHEGDQDGDEEAAVLTDDERWVACETAVTRVVELRDAEKDNDRMRSSLRHAFELVSARFMEPTSCDDLGRASVVAECERVVTMKDEIELFLREDRTMEEVCALVQEDAPLSHAPEELSITYVEDTPPPPPLSCKLCKRFVEMVNQAMEQDMAQVKLVRELLGDICDSMAADSTCHLFLQRYDDIVSWLKHGTSPEVVCERVRMCTTEESKEVFEVVPQQTATRPCFFCVHTTAVIRLVNMAMPQQLDTVHELLKKVCNYLPASLQCKKTEANFDKIVAWVQAGEPPKSICRSLALCPKSEDAEGKWAILMEDAAVEEMSSAIIAVDSFASSDKKCFYCDYLTIALEMALIEEPDEIGEIRQYADMICGMLGESNVCHQYVDKLDYVLDALKSGKKPREICKTLKFCTASSLAIEIIGITDTADTKAANPNAVALHAAFSLDLADDSNCFYCDYFVILLEVVIQEVPDQVNMIRQYADMICGALGDNEMCKQYVDKFDYALDGLQSGKKPREICQGLKYCTTLSDSLEAVAVDQRDVAELKRSLAMDFFDEKSCFYCDGITTMLEIAVQEGPDQVDEICEYADMICGIVQNDICTNYVNKLGSVVKDLKAGKKPRDICVGLTFCTAAANMVDSIPLKVMGDHVEEGPNGVTLHAAFALDFADDSNCFYCDYFVTLLEIVVQEKPAQVNMIRQYVDMICGALGDNEMCKQYVDKFDYALDGLQSGKKPREICQGLKYCTTLSDSIEAVGVDQRDVAELKRSLAMDLFDAKTCFYCDGVTTLVEIAVQEGPDLISEIRMYAEMICGVLGADNVCHGYVNKLVYVLDALKAGKKPHEICIGLKFCVATHRSDPNSKFLPVQPSVVDVLALKQTLLETMDTSFHSENGCFFCTQVASVLKVAMEQDPGQVDQIRQVAGLVCKMMPKENKCHVFVADMDRVIDSLRKGEAPGNICKDMKFCPAQYNDGHALVPSYEKGNKCAYCEGVLTILDFAIKEKSAQLQELREAAGIVCDLLPADDKCHDQLKMFDQAVKELKAGKPPHAVCLELQFCTSSDNLNGLSVKDLGLLDSSFMATKCTTCKQNTLLLASMATKPNGLETFRDEIDSVCRLIPDSAECDLLMRHYDLIVDSLANGDDVEAICTRIQSCPDPEPTLDASENEVSFSMGCLLCDYLAEVLTVGGTSDTELHLEKKALETMCFILPPSARCDVLSSKFDDLVQLIQEGKNPGEACAAISLCDASISKSLSASLPESTMPSDREELPFDDVTAIQ